MILLFDSLIFFDYKINNYFIFVLHLITLILILILCLISLTILS